MLELVSFSKDFENFFPFWPIYFSTNKKTRQISQGKSQPQWLDIQGLLFFLKYFGESRAVSLTTVIYLIILD